MFTRRMLPRKRRREFERLEDRRLLTIDITTVGQLDTNENGTVTFDSLQIFDSTPESSYVARIDWGDGTDVDEFSLTGPSLSSGINVRIDYSFDSQNFFDTDEKRNTLQAAADDISSLFRDELLAIESVGGNSFTAVIEHPGTGADERITDLSIAQNEIVIYAGGRQLGDTTLGYGGHGGYQASGNSEFFEIVANRGQDEQTDFGLWGGQIVFDIDADWHYSLSTDGLESGEFDFYSIALHELTHTFGFNNSNSSFSRHVAGLEFTGAEVFEEHDFQGAPEVNTDRSHWDDDLTDGGNEPVMTATIRSGVRKTLTDIDIAAFSDIGWDVISRQVIGDLSVSHQYLDDGDYNIQITISDNVETKLFTRSADVSNLAPQLNVQDPDDTEVGETVELTGLFSDVGTVDTHIVNVVWGDGQTTSATVNADAGTFAASHVYSTSGDFEILTSIVDDDGGSVQVTKNINVASTLSPVAVDEVFETNVDEAINLVILDNDVAGGSPLDPASLLFQSLSGQITGPENGTITLDSQTGSVLYVPNPGFEGIDGFRYTVSDVSGRQSNLATVTINVVSTTSLVWQNQTNTSDVNGDGQVTPIDVLMIINELNEPSVSASDGRLPTTNDSPIQFFDVNGDGFVAAIDALLIINFLNQDD